MSHAQGIRILFAAQSGTPLIPAGLTIECRASIKIGAHRLRSEQIRQVGELFRTSLFAIEHRSKGHHDSSLLFVLSNLSTSA